MSNLLIITKTVDENDQLLGFFIGWLREFAKRYNKINVLCLEKGNFSLPDNVKVVSLGKEKFKNWKIENSLKIENCKLKILRRFLYLARFYKYIWQMRREYDAVFVHMNAIYVVVGSWLWRLLGKQVFLWYAHKTITWQHQVAEKLADGIFASTPQGFRLKTNKLYIVGQGIDTDLFKPDSTFDIRHSTFKILSVGRIAPIKNYRSLIEAAEILDKRGVDFLITVVGAPIFPEDFEYEKKLKETIKDRDLEKKIKFEGKISNKNLPAYYQLHQVYINLSRTGSLDKTIVEAMASGCTVLSSNDSAREFLPPELIVDDNDPQKLADKIMHAKNALQIRPSEFLEGMNYGQRLRQYVVENHSLENLIEKISRIINRRTILIAGYPYIKENYIKTFERYPKPEDIFFLLPKEWKAKAGKITYKPPGNTGLNIFTTKAHFYHSNYPLIGGILKGWMPWLPVFLAKLKRKNLKLLYSASEPILLATLWNGIWARIFGLKHVVFSWENVSFEKKFKGIRGLIQKCVLKMNLGLADGIICGNKKCEEIFRRFKIKNLKFKILLCPLAGVDENLFKPGNNPEFKRRYNFAGKPVFTFVGAIGYRKGIHVALGAFKQVLDKFPNARFVIAGSGEYESQIEKLIDDLNLRNYITRIPWLKHEQLPELLNASDVFLYPSLSHGGWEEQFGYSMAEASMCEVPVIATKSGSIEDVVIDGKTGILVDENNVEQLADAITKLAGNEVLRKEMGRAGRQFILENYSNKIVAEKFYKFFERI